MDHLQAEKRKYCQIVKINKNDFVSKGDISQRTNGIFSTFSRTLVGRGHLQPEHLKREADDLSDFAYREIVYPILTTYKSILGSQVEFDI